MPAVRSASGPIRVPNCEAPISTGTPSRAMRGTLASGMRAALDFVGWAERACPTISCRARGGGHATLCPPYKRRYRRSDVPLRLEIRDLRCRRQQPSRRRPQFAVLVAVTPVENPGVGHRQHVGDVLGGEFLRRRMNIVVIETVPNGISSWRARNTRPKNASDIDISDSMSIFRGT